MLKTPTLMLFVAALLLAPVAAADDGKNPDPKWKQAIQKMLETKRITVDFTETPLDDVLQFVQQVCQINIVTDPRAKLDKELATINLKDVKLSTFLNTLGRLHKGLKVGYSCGQMVISKGKLIDDFPLESLQRPARLTDEQKANWEKLQRKVTLDFSGTPFQDVVQFMRETTSVNMVLDKALRLAEPKIDYRVEQVTCVRALSLMSVLAGAKMTFVDGMLHFAPLPKPKPKPMCKHCKGKLDAAFKFCPWCGKPTKKAEKKPEEKK